jgi:hypothetical protein
VRCSTHAVPLPYRGIASDNRRFTLNKFIFIEEVSPWLEKIPQHLEFIELRVT